MLATADGGETWSARDGASRHRLYDVAFASAEVAVAVGLGGTIVRSSDGGATWQRVRESGGWLAGVAFADAKRGFAVGHAEGEERLVLRSDDGGATWREAPGLPEIGAKATLRAIEFRDAQVGVAVGSGGLVLVTTDGGLQWSARAPAGLGDAYLRALCFQGEELWIAGERGLLLRSADLGATVVRLAVPDDGKLMGVAFATPKVGWTTTMGGRLLATQDGGASWAAIAKSDADAMTGIALRPDAALAVAVGGGGTIVLPVAVGADVRHRP